MKPPLYFACAFTLNQGMPDRVVRLAAAVRYGTRKARPGIRDAQHGVAKTDDYKSFTLQCRKRKAKMDATFHPGLGFTSWEKHRAFYVAGTPV